MLSHSHVTTVVLIRHSSIKRIHSTSNIYLYILEYIFNIQNIMKRLLKSIQKQRQSQQQPHHQSGKPNEIGVPHQSATTTRPTIQNHRPSQHAMVATDPPPYSDDDDEDVYHTTHPNQNEYDTGVDDVYTITNPQSPKKEEERNHNIVAEMERYYNTTNSSSSHHNKNKNSSHTNRNHPPNHNNNNIHPHPSTTTHPPKTAWSAVPPPSTTTEETRDLVKQFIADVWNRGALDRIPNICSPSLRFNGNTGTLIVSYSVCLWWWLFYDTHTLVGCFH